MQHIIVDLEFAPVLDKAVRKQMRNEVIEIGAVRLDDNYEYVDSFDIYVKPEHASFSKDLFKLTSISKTETNESPGFDEAIERFVNWIGPEKFRIYQWSENDKKQIVEECNYKSLTNKYQMLCGKHWRDLQRLYIRVFHKDHRQSLESALTELALDFDGKMHKACDDAKNTAKLLQIMAVKEKFDEVMKPIKDVLNAPKQGSTLGDLLGGINLSKLYALC